MAFTTVGIKDQGGTTKNMGALQDAAGNQYPLSSGDSQIAHYSASKSQLTPVATPTAVFILPGNATTTVRVKRIQISGIATSAGSMPCSIKVNSSAGTLGSAVLTALTAVPHDSTAAAASSVPSSVGTANYTTPPTLVGAIWSGEVEMGASGTGAFAPVDLNFGVGGRQAIVLRGATQNLTIDMLGAAVPSGGKLDFYIEWAEDAS